MKGEEEVNGDENEQRRKTQENDFKSLGGKREKLEGCDVFEKDYE